MFFLASAAILYPVWPFLVAAWRALRNGVLNMAVLVFLSVASLAGNAGTLPDRLNGADLIVGVHDADEDRLRCDRRSQIVGVDAPGAVDRQIRQGAPSRSRKWQGSMIAGCSTRVVTIWSPLALSAKKAPLSSRLLLAPAASEDDLVAPAFKQSRDLTACCLKRGLCLG